MFVDLREALGVGIHFETYQACLNLNLLSDVFILKRYDSIQLKKNPSLSLVKCMCDFEMIASWHGICTTQS